MSDFRTRYEKTLRLFNVVLENNTKFLEDHSFSMRPFALNKRELEMVVNAEDTRRWYLRCINSLLSEYAYYYPYN